MSCSHCRQQMRVKTRTGNQILWVCPSCGHMKLEDTGEEPPSWDSIESYKEDL